MTFDDFKTTVSARFPTIPFEFSTDDHDEVPMFTASHDRASIRHYVDSAQDPESAWRFSVCDRESDYGPTLDAAIDAHQLRISRIVEKATALGLMP